MPRAAHYGRTNIVLSFSSLCLQNSRVSICIWCILPQQFQRIVKRRASSGIDRSTKFDFNFDTLLFFHLCHYHWHHKNVLANFSASVLDACRKFSGDDLSANVDTNSLPSLTIQLLRHFWPSGALNIWLSSTLINSFAVQHAFFKIFMSMTCSPERTQSTN